MRGLEKIKQIRQELSIGLSEAKELFLEFEDVDLAVNYWRGKKREIEIAEKNKKYEDELDWFFDSEHCPNLKEEEKEKINLLTPNFCRKIWTRYVSKRRNHLMQVNSADEWNIEHLELLDFKWGAAWDNDNNDYFKEKLPALVNWNPNDKVFFLYGKYGGYEATWEFFLTYWINFFYEDEKNILINPKSDTVIIFTVHGLVEKGKLKEA